MAWATRGKTCSNECKQNLTRQTNLALYGDEIAQRSLTVKEKRRKKIENEHDGLDPSQTEEARAKRAATNQERYGHANPLASAEIRAKATQTNVERFGVDNPMKSQAGRELWLASMREKYGTTNTLAAPGAKEKLRATSLKRYGTPHPSASEEVQDKAKNTLQARYGTSSIGKLDWFREKVRKTSQDRYGVDHPMQSPAIQAKSQLTNLERLGVPFPSQNPESKRKAQETFAKNVKLEGFSHRRVSKLNIAFAKEIESKFGMPVALEAPFSGGAADLEVGSILLDLNPTVTHNSAISLPCLIKKCGQPCQNHKARAQNYHFLRAQAALRDDVTFIQLYDWDEPENIVRFLSAKIAGSYKRVSARKLDLKEVTLKEANEFLSQNHFQGSVRGQSVCLGLYSDKEGLLALATFGPARFKAKAEYEWYRFAVKDNFIVHGGAGKLWKSFLSVNKPSSVISYVDFNHTTKQQTFLHSLDFEELRMTGPSLVWHSSLAKKRIPENSLLKLGADRLLATSYGSREDSGLDNHDIMMIEGYLPVYTAGNRVLLWTKD